METWLAEAGPDGGVLRGANGRALEHNTQLHPSAICQALFFAKPGDTIVVRGDHFASGMPDLRLGHSPNRGNNISTNVDGQPIHGLRLVGEGGEGAKSGARLAPFYISAGHYQEASSGEVHNLDCEFENLAVAARWKFGFLFAKGFSIGNVRWKQVHVQDVDREVDGGSPAYWGWRLHGPPVNCSLVQCSATGMFEHGGYSDNAVDLEVRDCHFTDCGNCGWQEVNRKESGPQGRGFIKLVGNQLDDCGSRGGACLSITEGHAGRAHITGNRVDSRHDTYGVLINSGTPIPSKSKQGSYLVNGVATLEAVIADNKISVPNTNRGSIAVASVGRLNLGANEIAKTVRPDVRICLPKYGHGPVKQLCVRIPEEDTWPSIEIEGSVRPKADLLAAMDADQNLELS